MGEQQREVVRDFPLTSSSSQTDSLVNLEKLQVSEQGQDQDCFVLMEDDSLALESRFYHTDDEGSEGFYKYREEGVQYVEMENVQDGGIQAFIKSLPQTITYNSVFEASPHVSKNNPNEPTKVEANPTTEGDEKKKRTKPKQVECPVCQRTLAQGSMKKHMQVLHSAVKFTANCDQCDLEFDTRKELWTHKQKAHQVKAGRKSTKLTKINSHNSSVDENSCNSGVVEGSSHSSSVTDNSHKYSLENTSMESPMLEDVLDDTMDNTLLGNMINESLNNLDEHC